MVSKKRQQSGIIDCTFTIASISSISRFACAIVWLVWVITSSVYVIFARICFAFVNICQKKREKEKRMKMGFGFHSGAIHVHVWKPRTLVGNWLVSCDSLVETESQTVILKFFYVGTANIPKAYSINCSYLPWEQKPRYINSERKNEEREIIPYFVRENDEGLTLKTSALKSERWPIYVINPIDNT